MTVKRKVGLEAEFLLINAKGEAIVPPGSWDRDGFPLLGEIRGAPGEDVPEVISNFERARLEVLGKLRKGHTITMENRFRVGLKTYKEANAQTNWDEKHGGQNKIENIYDIDIENYSDQILKDGKIQGIWVSCGLHIHFSCEEYQEEIVKIPKYEQCNFPIGLTVPNGMGEEESNAMEEIIRPFIYLYRHAGYDEKKKFIARASKLNNPTTRWMVKSLDKELFNKYAPPEKERTKYRQPGFFERKPYGFEYRSLPANPEVLSNLAVIAAFAFELLGEAAT